MNRAFAFVPLAVFLVMAGYFAFGLRENPNEIPSQLIDEPLPEFSLPAPRLTPTLRPTPSSGDCKPIQAHPWART